MKKQLFSLFAVLTALFTGCSLNDVAVSLAQERIRQSHASCILLKDGHIITQESGKGLAPLFTVLDKYSKEMNGGVIVDKVIGKAAASLVICGKASAVYTELISEPALELLKKHGVKVQYGKCVPQILNRNKSGLCPMEERVAEIDDPQKAVEVLRTACAALNKK